MGLRKVTDFMERGLSPLVSVVGNLGAGLIAVMMLLTVVDVVGRRFFHHPLTGAYELSEYLMVIVVFFSMVGCQLLKGHITIDLVVDKFRQRTRNIIDSIMYVFFLMMFGVLTWRFVLDAIRETGGSTSGVLNIPDFPFLYLAALGSALLSLVVLMHLFLFLAGAVQK